MTRDDQTTLTATPASEQARLDDAIRRADELLVDSLRRDDAQLQQRRRRGRLALWVTGGLVMVAAVIFALVFAVAGAGRGAASAKPQAAEAERAKALSLEGWRLWQQQRPADAEAKFVESVKLDATSPHAWNGLGWSQVNQGRNRDAAAAFQKAIALAPDHAGASNGLGQAYLGVGKLDDAEPHLLRAAAHDASPAWWGLARIYLLRKDFDRALPWALLILRDSPADATVQAMLQAVRKRELSEDLRKQIAPADAG